MPDKKPTTKSEKTKVGRQIDMSAIFAQSEIRDTFRISYLANLLVLPVYDNIMREHGLNRAEYLLLFCLAHFEELTAQDVAEMTGRPRNSISRAVHRMLEDGLLSRSPHPTDGRQILLRITDAGRKMEERIRPDFKNREESILSTLNQQERRQLDKLLQKLVTGQS